MRTLNVILISAMLIVTIGGAALLFDDQAKQNETVDIANQDPLSSEIEFSLCTITLNFDNLSTPYIGYDYYGNPSYEYGDPVADFYSYVGVYFEADDIPVNATGVDETSYPNSVFGGLQPWDAKPIVVSISPTVLRVGVWTIDSGYYNSPAGNEVSAEFYDEDGNLIGTVNADHDLVPSRQFLAFEATEGIAKIVFRELQRPGDAVDDFFIDDLMIDRDCEPENVTATIDCDPNTLNLKSKGKWITCYIELPGGYDVRDIDASTILLEDALLPELDPKYGFVKSESSYIMDHDGDGIEERMVKFDRNEVQALLMPGEYNLKIMGSLHNGTGFEGYSDKIRVINSGGGTH